MKWAFENNQFNFGKSRTNRINFQTSYSSFYSDELSHFGADGKCEIVFNIDSNWFSNLKQIAGSNACGIPVNTTHNPNIHAGTPYTVVSGNGITPLNKPCTLTVTFTHLKLYMSCAYCKCLCSKIYYTV